MKRIKELEDLIKYHKALYYQGRPEISDNDFDQIEEELRSLDPSNNTLKMVGSFSSSLEKVAHKSKMLSLNKTYKEDDLISWMGDQEVVSTFKIDGVSCSLIYNDGHLKVAKTRGDGSFGEDITKKVNWISSVPSTISEDKSSFEIRGEIYCEEESFYRLSDEMESLGLDRPSNQRNIVAGLMGRKENFEISRHLNFKAFDLITEKKFFETEVEKFEYLKKLSFDIPDFVHHKDHSLISKVLKGSQDFMSSGNFQIDGLVFTINRLSLHEEMGETSHHPRYKMAFKFQGESKNTTIESIEWSVSRNGILTPVALVNPVDLSGAMIGRVTLHNYGLVKQHQLKEGDEIEIVRSGEVIPKFLSVVQSSKNKFIIPEKCPSCNRKTKEVEIRIFCPNENCPGRVKESILNFIQKIGIDDLSSKRLDEMMTQGLVKNIKDLYLLKKEDLLRLDKVKEKLANKLLDSIKKSYDVDLTTFLSSLGIQGGAYNKCEKIVLSGFNTIDKIYSITLEELLKVESFAEKSSTEFLNSLSEKYELIKDLESLGFSFQEKKVKETEVLGKKICITGSLSRKRSEIEKDIRDFGGIIVSSVSKNTDILLTNDTEVKSSKLKKALDLGIKIISEDNLLEMIQ